MHSSNGNENDGPSQKEIISKMSQHDYCEVDERSIIGVPDQHKKEELMTGIVHRSQHIMGLRLQPGRPQVEASKQSFDVYTIFGVGKRRASIENMNALYKQKASFSIRRMLSSRRSSRSNQSTKSSTRIKKEIDLDPDNQISDSCSESNFGGKVCVDSSTHNSNASLHYTPTHSLEEQSTRYDEDEDDEDNSIFSKYSSGDDEYSHSSDSSNSSVYCDDEMYTKREDKDSFRAKAKWSLTRWLCIGFAILCLISLVTGVTARTDTLDKLSGLILDRNSNATYAPSSNPSSQPTIAPSNYPSTNPSLRPTFTFPDLPSNYPSKAPTDRPSRWPSLSPSLSSIPSNVPSFRPSVSFRPTLNYSWNEVRGRLIGGPKKNSEGGFGNNVSLSKDGNTLAVATFAYDTVEVYENIDERWILRGDPIPPPPGGDSSEIQHAALIVSLSSDGNMVAIGGNKYDSSRGLVRVFKWGGTETAWVQVGQSLVGSGWDYFGSCIALSGSGTSLVISAMIGRVTAYQLYGTVWFQRGRSHSESVSTGLGTEPHAISMTEDGNYFAIGAMYAEFVLIFGWDENVDDWVQVGSKLEPELKNHERYGAGVKLTKLPSGNLVVATVMTSDGLSNLNMGEIRIYDYDVLSDTNAGGATAATSGDDSHSADNDTDWVERGGRITSPISDPDGNKRFEYSFQLSDNGNSVLAHADTDFILFDWDESKSMWNYRAIVASTKGPFDPYLAGMEYSIDMTGDANVVVIGMPYDDDGYSYGENVGQVRTYSVQNSS